MIGLGVGIDYALFIVTRYRQGLATRACRPGRPIVTAIGTAGRAVLFAGGTVVISLLGMFTMGLSYLDGVAASAVLAVLVRCSRPRSRCCRRSSASSGTQDRPLGSRSPAASSHQGDARPSGTAGAGSSSAGRGSPSPAAPWCC